MNFFKKILRAEFFSNFKNFDTKIFGKVSSFLKKIIKKFKFGLNVPKMIEKSKFYPNFEFFFEFWINFEPIFKILVPKSLKNYVHFQINIE